MATITQLNRGMSGPSVKAMQQDLLALGFKLPRYGADGIFGAETEKAVKDFQYTYGVAVDGIVGPQTAAAIKEAIKLLAEGRWDPEADPLQYPEGMIAAPPTTPSPTSYPTPTVVGRATLFPPIPTGGITLPIIGTIPWTWFLIGGIGFIVYMMFFRESRTGKKRRYSRNEPEE